MDKEPLLSPDERQAAILARVRARNPELAAEHAAIAQDADAAVKRHQADGEAVIKLAEKLLNPEK